MTRGSLCRASWPGYYTRPTAFEGNKMMLHHYQQTKNILISFGTKVLGFF